MKQQKAGGGGGGGGPMSNEFSPSSNIATPGPPGGGQPSPGTYFFVLERGPSPRVVTVLQMLYFVLSVFRRPVLPQQTAVEKGRRTELDARPFATAHPVHEYV